jgi:hypothetical protein
MRKDPYCSYSFSFFMYFECGTITSLKWTFHSCRTRIKLLQWLLNKNSTYQKQFSRFLDCNNKNIFYEKKNMQNISNMKIVH